MQANNWTFRIEREPGSDMTRFYLIKHDSMGGRRHATITDGIMCLSSKSDAGSSGDPMFTCYHFPDATEDILLAMAEGLRRAGIEIEVDEKRKAAALAVSADRKDMLEYFKGLNSEIIRLI